MGGRRGLGAGTPGTENLGPDPWVLMDGRAHSGAGIFSSPEVERAGLRERWGVRGTRTRATVLVVEFIRQGTPRGLSMQFQLPGGRDGTAMWNGSRA